MGQKAPRGAFHVNRRTKKRGTKRRLKQIEDRVQGTKQRTKGELVIIQEVRKWEQDRREKEESEPREDKQESQGREDRVEKER